MRERSQEGFDQKSNGKFEKELASGRKFQNEVWSCMSSIVSETNATRIMFDLRKPEELKISFDLLSL